MNIKNKMYISFLSSMITVLLIMGLILYLKISTSYVENIKTMTIAINDAKSEAVSKYMEGIRRELKTEAGKDILKTMDKGVVIEHLKKEILTRTDTYDNFFIADTFGDYISTLDKSGNIKDRPYFIELIQSGKDYVISEPLFSKSTGKPMFVFAYAIKDDSGKIIGMLGNNITLDTISKIAQGVKVGKTGYGWIVDEKGLVFAHPDAEMRMNLNLYQADKMKVGISEATADNIVKNESGIEKSKGIKKENIIIFHKKIPETPGWTFAISVPESELYKELYDIIKVLIVLIIIILGVVAVVSHIISDSITRPMNEIISKIDNMAGGDYSQTVGEKYIKRKDEIGKLAQGFNTINDSVSAVVKEIKLSSEKVASASTELSASMKGIAEGAQAQSGDAENLNKGISDLKSNMENVMGNVRMQVAAVEETSSSMSEISYSVKEVAKNSENAKNVADETSKAAEEGAESVKRTIDGIKKIEDVVIKVEEKVLLLSESYEEIGNVVNVIDEIAGQTNLLALNAAIEAAHAGEVGKGFAVVADEIKDLAERSRDATKEIEKMIKGVQRHINEVKEEAKQGRSEVENGKELSIYAQSKLVEIKEKVKVTNAEIQNVTKVVEEQSVAIEEISKAIEEITRGSANVESLSMSQLETTEGIRNAAERVQNITEKTVAETEEVLASSEELANVAEILRDIVDQLKIKENVDKKGIREM